MEHLLAPFPLLPLTDLVWRIRPCFWQMPESSIPLGQQRGLGRETESLEVKFLALDTLEHC